MPPESWSGYWFAASSSPTSSTICCARACARPSTCPAPRARTRRSRSRCGARAGRSAGRPSRPCAPQLQQLVALAAVTSRPSISMRPAVGSIRRMSVRTSVDLPEPDRPITTKTSPGQTWNLTSRTAVMQPVCSRSSRPGELGGGRADDLVGVRPEDLPDSLRPDQRRGIARRALLDAVRRGQPSLRARRCRRRTPPASCRGRASSACRRTMPRSIPPRCTPAGRGHPR